MVMDKKKNLMRQVYEKRRKMFPPDEGGWSEQTQDNIFVYIQRTSQHVVCVNNPSAGIDEMTEWATTNLGKECMRKDRKNCYKGWNVGCWDWFHLKSRYHFYFLDENDAMLFKMRWG